MVWLAVRRGEDSSEGCVVAGAVSVVGSWDVGCLRILCGNLLDFLVLSVVNYIYTTDVH